MASEMRTPLYNGDTSSGPNSIEDCTRNTHAQWASCQVYASPIRLAQLCTHMSINDIPDRDRHIHHENRISHSERLTNALGNNVLAKARKEVLCAQ